jgi:hypothetical protein
MQRARRRSSGSLLAIPLLAQVFNDPCFAIIRRGVDSRWKYQEVIDRASTDSIPSTAPCSSALIPRVTDGLPIVAIGTPFNESDELVPEALFCVHDYLHAGPISGSTIFIPAWGLAEAPLPGAISRTWCSATSSAKRWRQSA